MLKGLVEEDEIRGSTKTKEIENGGGSCNYFQPTSTFFFFSFFFLIKKKKNTIQI